MKKFFFTLLAISFLPVIAFADEPPELRKLRQEAINLYFKARSEEDKTNKHDLYKKALEKLNSSDTLILTDKKNLNLLISELEYKHDYINKKIKYKFKFFHKLKSWDNDPLLGIKYFEKV